MSFYAQVRILIQLVFQSRPIVFCETMYDQPGIRYFVTALSEELAASDCFVVKLQSLRQEEDPVSEEMQGRTLLLRYFPVVCGLLLGLPKILGFAYAYIFPSKNRTFKLSYRGIDVSNEFSDVMDINLGLGWQAKSSRAVMIRGMIEISYASFIAAVFLIFQHRIKWAISADSAYRYGFITRAAQSSGVPVITNIDLNGLFMNVYSPKTLSGARGRKITEEDCAKIEKLFPNWRAEIDKYFERRFAGELLQHDVLNAYNGGKGKKSAQEIRTSQRDISSRLVVTVFAHVFRDAPRNIPGTLFGDFYRWFVASVSVLAENPNVDIYIREHPSAHLYGEKNLVSKVLEQLGLSDRVKLWGGETTDEVLALTDVVVTCSGTVGLEAAYLGKIVVIASRCSYSQLGLCHEFERGEDYLAFLDAMTQKVDRPAAYKIDKAAQVAFIHFNLFNNRNRYGDFPLPPFVRGVTFGKSGKEFYRGIREYVSGPTVFHADLRQFLGGSDSRFLPALFTSDRQAELGSVSGGAKRDSSAEYSVVIVGFRSQCVIASCLDALIRQARAAGRRIQIIVVDNDPEQEWGTLREIKGRNFSTDDSIEIRLIKSPRNGGFSFGCNLGAKEAVGRWLLFLNPDAFLAENFFRDLESDLCFVSEAVKGNYPIVMGLTMVDSAGGKTRNGGILPERFAFQYGMKRHIFESGYLLKVERHDVDGLVWPLGAGFLVSNEVFNNVGGFDEGLFLTLEEPSFLKKLQRYVLYFSKAVAVHDGGHSYANRLAEYKVFQQSLKHYFTSAKFDILGTLKILLTLSRIKSRILALTVSTALKNKE